MRSISLDELDREELRDFFANLIDFNKSNPPKEHEYVIYLQWLTAEEIMYIEAKARDWGVNTDTFLVSLLEFSAKVQKLP